MIKRHENVLYFIETLKVLEFQISGPEVWNIIVDIKDL